MFQDDVEKALPTQEDELISIIRAKGTTELDLQEVSLHPLHSSKNMRGRFAITTEFLSGSSVEEAKRFVPENLTRRIMIYKASVFNLLGKFTPVLVGLSKDLREAVKQTKHWDDAVPDELRSKWVGNFLKVETLLPNCT